MKNSIYIFSVAIALGAAHANTAHAACSVADLTRCLDSVCAINVSSNPAARCQYCGTTDAGTPTNTMRSVSVGTSAKYNLSAKELQKAPDAPSARYAWAIRQCIARVDRGRRIGRLRQFNRAIMSRGGHQCGNVCIGHCGGKAGQPIQMHNRHHRMHD